MSRKNINLQSEQQEILRARKLHFQQAFNIGKLSDIDYIMRISQIFQESLKLKGK